MKKKYLPLIAIAITSISSCETEPIDLQDKKEIHKVEVTPDNEGGNNILPQYDKIKTLLDSKTRLTKSNSSQNFFGGLYVDEDENLVYLTTNTSEDDNLILFKEIVPKIIIKECQYKYTDLEDILNIIRSKFKENKSLFHNIASFGIDEKNNTVDVSLLKCNEETIEQFKDNIIDSQMLSFSEGSRVTDESLVDGTIFYCNVVGTNVSRGSIGYRAKNNSGVKGIVTAGHCINENEYVLAPNYEQIGLCIQSVANNGVIDAAFCDIFQVQDYAPSNRINYMTNPLVDTLHTDVYNPPTGVYINMIGGASGCRRSGIVKYSSRDVLNNTGSVICTNCIYADYNSVGGDSGSLIYTLVSSINKRYTTAIHKGRSTINGVSYGISVKASVINNYFGLTRY